MSAREYLVEEGLRDGRVVTVQRVKPDEPDTREQDSYSLSRSALFHKFLMPDRELDERELIAFTDSNLFQQTALFLCVESDGKSVPVGCGQYVRNNRPDTSSSAELTIGVSADYPRTELKAILLRHLIKLAKSEGVTAFTTAYPANSIVLFDALREIDQSVISVYAAGAFSLLLPIS